MKLFVVSDIHSYFKPFKKALDAAGFDENNPNHWLISCGDAFDRGSESKEVLHFLMSLERKTLIKGNHDLLFEHLCARGFPYSRDKSNGTVQTVQDLGESIDPENFSNCCQIAWNKTAAFRDLLVNYFETEKYIFVHSWIPTNVKYEGKMEPWYHEGKTLTYMEDWRNASSLEWEEAMWGNPFKRWKEGLNKTGKIIVFGHWHCSAGHAMLQEVKISENESEGTISEFEDDAIWEPFIYDNIIGIDRCTAYTSEVNVLVLEDNFIENIE